MDLKEYVHYAARAIEVIGVVILLIGTILALVRFLFSMRNATSDSYTVLRQSLGRTILLGLEVLVAADIIATVVTEPTMDRVLTLGLIVLIRILLSISIQVEVEGRFPWHKKDG